MARPPSSTDWLAEAEQACVRARQLTWQLLTFSKGGVPTRKTVAIAPILHESVGLALRGSSVTCTLDIAPDLWSVDADAGQLLELRLVAPEQLGARAGDEDCLDALALEPPPVEGARLREQGLRVEHRRGQCAERRSCLEYSAARESRSRSERASHAFAP